VDGALFPKAQVRFINRSTKRSISVLTDFNGEYFVELTPGTYDVFVEAASWKPARRKKFKVEKGVQYVVDFVLNPGKPVIVDGEHP
jgi:hypothetical protein